MTEVRFRRDVNQSEIIHVFQQQHVRKACSDDFLIQFMTDEAVAILLQSPTAFFVGVDLEEFGGFFLLERKSGCAAEVHTCLLRNAWGKTKEIGKAFTPYAFKELEWMRVLTTQVPQNNPLAKRLALSAGFIHCGTYPDYWLADGIPVGMDHFYLKEA